MRTKDKLDLIKECMLITNPEIDENEWQEMLRTDGFSGFLDGVCLAIDTHFNRKAIRLLIFKKSHPHIKKDEEIILAYELSENIKRTLKKIE